MKHGWKTRPAERQYFEAKLAARPSAKPARQKVCEWCNGTGYMMVPVDGSHNGFNFKPCPEGCTDPSLN